MQCTSSFADQRGGHLRRAEIKRSNMRNWSEKERISPNTHHFQSYAGYYKYSLRVINFRIHVKGVAEHRHV